MMDPLESRILRELKKLADDKRRIGKGELTNMANELQVPFDPVERSAAQFFASRGMTIVEIGARLEIKKNRAHYLLRGFAVRPHYLEIHAKIVEELHDLDRQGRSSDPEAFTDIAGDLNFGLRLVKRSATLFYDNRLIKRGEIAERLWVDRRTLTTWLKEFEPSPDDRSFRFKVIGGLMRSVKPGFQIDRTDLIVLADHLMVRVRTVERIAASFFQNVKLTAELRTLYEAGVRIDVPVLIKLADKFVKTLRPMIALFLVNRRASEQEVCQAFGRSHFTVTGWLQRFNVKPHECPVNSGSVAC